MKITVEKERREFSKVVLGAVIVLYFAVAVYAAVIVWNVPEHLPELLTYIGAPTATAIGFYAWKAKAENVLKLSRSAETKAAITAAAFKETEG